MDNQHISARTRALINAAFAEPARRPRPALARLLTKVTPGHGGCWIYTGNIHKNTGYGCFTISAKKRTSAHRAAYELLVAPIPPGAHLDHTCHTADDGCPGGISCLHRRCVNPLHLEPVTAQENLLRSRRTVAGRNARKTHCPQGHEYTPENTGTNSKGRYCRACGKARIRTVSNSGGAR
ncbi:hypothetical protein AB0I54_31795 [Streptomyces sp. NPDC050625]|uniref:hypothetical protein n=1 Tax=Streptomyces sp. NPDC050625 TaxID=3154629 RepID=UPI0034151275